MVKELVSRVQLVDYNAVIDSMRTSFVTCQLIGALCTLASLIGAQPVDAERVADTRFNYKRGFYSTGFTVIVQTRTEGASIRYTLDGSTPSALHGLGDTNPVTVRIERTTVLRAMAYKPGAEPTNVDTNTYLFPEDVVRQPAEVPGYPAPRLRSGIGEAVTLDYEMDPEIVGDPLYWMGLRRGLRAIPSLSLALDKDHLFRRVELPDSPLLDNSRSGVYWGESGDGSTVPLSVELIVAGHPEREFQADAAMESHSWGLVKRAFRLKFMSEYGAGKLNSSVMKHAPLNGKSATDRFDRLVLRSGKNRSWATGWGPDRTAYIRDQWARDSQIAMSGAGAHGVFVHLYINGLYWGLYNLSERPDAWFMSEYFGGEKQDWTSVKHDGVLHGNPDRWATLRGELKDRDLRDPDNYAAVKEYLDVAWFADYLILCWYMGLSDWPDNNWYGNYRASPPSPMMFFIWDAEMSWVSNQEPAAWVHPRFRRDASSSEPSMVGIWHALRRNPDFMQLFADRVFFHCFGDGALTEEASIERWRVLAAAIEDSVIAESARWGDARAELGEAKRTQRDTFFPEVERVEWNMKGNVARFIGALRQQAYYPSLDPPLASRHRRMTGGEAVELSNPNDGGLMIYTLDGADPRLPGGALYERALSSSEHELRVDSTNRGAGLKARVKLGDVWSALVEISSVAHSP